VIANNVIVGAPAQLYPDHNFFPASVADVGFVDLSKGDYRLTSKSPYKGRATDGRDVGANSIVSERGFNDVTLR